MKKFLILASMLVFSFNAFSTLVRADIVEDGLVSYWNFDNIVGDTVEDAWRDNDGTIFGDPEIVEGKFGSKALKFDGQDDYVEFPDSDSLDGMSGISVLLWANVETLSDVAGTDQSFINKDAAGWGARLYRIYLDQPTNTIHSQSPKPGGRLPVRVRGAITWPRFYLPSIFQLPLLLWKRERHYRPLMKRIFLLIVLFD